MTHSRENHRAFLNSYYGKMKHFYDLSRKFFLFGRSRVLKDLTASSWNSLIEIGPGTGRNLSLLHESRPQAAFGGLEASDEMLSHAKMKCPWAKIEQGFAETADLESILGSGPDRILFSYCLSMVQSQEEAIVNARKSLAPNGELIIVDFGDFQGLPDLLHATLSKWLALHHVYPLSEALLREQEAEISWGPGRYYVIARVSPLV